MTTSITNHFKSFFFLLLLSIAGLSSCKKDKQSNPANLIVGTWTVNNVDLKYYDVKTGDEIPEPDGYETTVRTGVKVIFKANGQYTADNDNGTYKYNADSKIITISPTTGGADDYEVLVLDEHTFKLKIVINATDAKIVFIQTFSK